MRTLFIVSVLDVIKILLGIFVVLICLGGLTAFGYSFRKKKFVHSHAFVLYSFVVIISFALVYTQQILEDYSAHQFDIRNAGKLYYYLNVISAMVSLLSAFILTNKTVRFLNDLKLFKILTFFKSNNSVMISSIWMIAMKAIVFPIILEATLILRQKRNEPEKHLLWTLYTLLPWIIANIIPNCFFGFQVANKQLMMLIGNMLEDITKEVNSMQTKLQMKLQKPYYRMGRFCDLADKLDELALKYTQVQDKTLEVMDLLAAPFLCSLVCNLFGITAGLFAHYHAIADTLINEDDYDIFNALTSSVFLMISVCEIFLQAHFSNESLVMSKRTGQILQRMNILHADVRFKQSVEEFSLLILMKDFKIQPWGLLEINVALLHDVLSAVTSFLLILIQSDLALRFSLK